MSMTRVSKARTSHRGTSPAGCDFRMWPACNSRSVTEWSESTRTSIPLVETVLQRCFLIPIVAPLAKEWTIFEVSSVEIMGYDEVK